MENIHFFLKASLNMLKENTDAMDDSIITVNDGVETTSVHVGPQIICDNVETINTENKLICLSCKKRNPIILTISNTFSFVFGAFLDNICCCLTSVSKRAMVTALVTILVVGATTGGLAST